MDHYIKNDVKLEIEDLYLRLTVGVGACVIQRGSKHMWHHWLSVESVQEWFFGDVVEIHYTIIIFIN